MTISELFLSIGWFEWIFYTFIIVVAFCFIFNVELSYTLNMAEHYHSPFFSTLWYSFFLPDKYLKHNSYNITNVRQLEMYLNGLENGVIKFERNERHCELSETNNNKRYPLKFYISESNVVILDGNTICLPPTQLIQILKLWHDSEKETKKPKKTLLT